MIQPRAIGFIFTSLLILRACADAHADDWPQWRGPQRTGISQEKGLLREWPPAGPKLLWHVKDLGGGFSTPAVVGDRIYLLNNTGLQDESVLCLSVADAKTLWSTRLGRVGNPTQQPNYPATRSTPTVDGDALYALGSDGDLACLETASGKLRWTKNLRKEFGGEPGIWAYAESPLIDGDVLLCTPGGKTATIVALNKKTGDPIWKCALPTGDQAAYASALVADTAGVRQYIEFVQKGLVGVEAKTGKPLWRYEHTAQGSAANIPTPVVQGDYVYSAAGQSGCGLVKLSPGEGGSINAEEVYFNKQLPNAIGGAILLGDELYGTNSRGLVCANFKTGDVKWSDKSIGSASLCYVDGCLYLHGENGEVALVEATAQGYHEKGRFTPPDQPDRGKAKAWAYPVIANGRLYLRDLGVLWCYDVRAAGSARGE
jgi:outer membrane protein assembly factor BamB